MTGIFDTHAHYDDAAFDADREALLASLPECGVCGIINCGTTLKSSQATLELAERWSYVYAAVGIHPSELDSVTEDSCDRLRELYRHPRAVAVGEIGLDYHYDTFPRELQREWLERQLKRPGDFAQFMGSPVLVKTYQPKDGRKEFAGTLAGYEDGAVLLDMGGETVRFEKNETALVRLRVEF